MGGREGSKRRMCYRYRDRQLGHCWWVVATETFHYSLDEELIFTVAAVELAGPSSQLDGLGDG